MNPSATSNIYISPSLVNDKVYFLTQVRLPLYYHIMQAIGFNGAVLNIKVAHQDILYDILLCCIGILLVIANTKHRRYIVIIVVFIENLIV